MYKKNIVGPQIRKARKELRVTQMQLTTQLQLLGIKIDRSGIAKIESRRRPTSDIEIAAIAKILKVSISGLFEEGGEVFNQATHNKA